MTRYLISFAEGAMTFPEEELPAVAEAAHAVMFAAQDAGVWVTGGGLLEHTEGTLVDEDGTVTSPAFPPGQEHLGGFSILDLPDRDEAHAWGARMAKACRCAQSVRELMHDPDV